MDSVPKFIVSVITIVLGVLLCVSLVISTVVVNSARTYHSSIIEHIEASNFDEVVIEQVKLAAQKDNYKVTIERQTASDDEPYFFYKVTLRYGLYAPLFGRVHTGTIVGYALSGSHVDLSGTVTDHYFEIDENGVLGIKKAYRWATGLDGDYVSDNGKDAPGSKNSLLPSEIVIPEYFDGVKVVALRDDMFANCSGLTSLFFTNGVKTIGANAFANCTNLTGKIVLPDSVTTIKDGAFSNCSAIAGFDLGDSVKTIGANAFKNCSGITSMTFPDTMQSVGLGALSGCNKLAEFTAPFAGGDATTKNVSQLGYLFGATKYSDNASYVPASLKSVHLTKYASKYALYNCANITNLTIGDAATKIDEYFAYSCDGLTKVIIPSKVTSTSSSSFASCDKLSTVIFESDNTLKTIGAATFHSCKSLSAIKIPTSVTSIGNYAFQDCDKLTFSTKNDGKLPEGLLTLGIGVFKECDGFSTFIIPASVTSVKNQIFTECKNLVNIQVASGNTAYCIGEAGELLTIDKKQIVQYPYAGPTTYTIPNSIVTIGDDAFAECDLLRYLYFPDEINSKITTIGYGAFRRCSKIENDLRIPNSVTFIDEEAFRYCGNFKNLYISSGLTKVERSAFYGAGTSAANLNIYVLSDNLDSIAEEGLYCAMGSGKTCYIHVKNESIAGKLIVGTNYSSSSQIVIDANIS